MRAVARRGPRPPSHAPRACVCADAAAVACSTCSLPSRPSTHKPMTKGGSVSRGAAAAAGGTAERGRGSAAAGGADKKLAARMKAREGGCVRLFMCVTGPFGPASARVRICACVRLSVCMRVHVCYCAHARGLETAGGDRHEAAVRTQHCAGGRNRRAASGARLDCPRWL